MEVHSKEVPSRSNDETSPTDSMNVSKCCSCEERLPNETPPLDKKIKKHRSKLWEFLRDLLNNPEYCPKIICWVDYDKRTFRFVQSSKVAELWGERYHRKDRAQMTIGKLSRAMRYYYREGNMILSACERRNTYKFGENVKGLETNDPNFKLQRSLDLER